MAAPKDYPRLILLLRKGGRAARNKFQLGMELLNQACRSHSKEMPLEIHPLGNVKTQDQEKSSCPCSSGTGVSASLVLPLILMGDG